MVVSKIRKFRNDKDVRPYKIGHGHGHAVSFRLEKVYVCQVDVIFIQK